MSSRETQKTFSNNYRIAIDMKAGLVVFLIALPLSLGISIASGAPSSAGLIAAIMGGLVGAYLGGSYVTINGPAAGLIVVVLSAIQSLGEGDPMIGFRRMLGCVVLVGLLQVVSGLLKAGRLAALFPLSVVHGMLSAIGLIIMIKQAHVFLGHNSSGPIFNSIKTLPGHLMNPIPESALIGLASLVILLAYPQIKIAIAKIIPAPLVVAVVSVVMAIYLHPSSMVLIPTSPSELLITPLFDVIFSLNSLLATISIFFVASLESILSASAVDKLDPLERESNFDRELWSKGAVNLACGFLGGLPIIAEIVRSSANISQGARSPLSNFSHSIFILIFVIAFPDVLNMIPLSALAAILLLVGYRLANPKQFKSMYHLGINSFLAFITTIIVTLAEDLLLGIAAGVLMKVIVSFLMGARLNSILRPTFKIEASGDDAILSFEGSLTFFSILRQKDILFQASGYRHLKIDLSKVNFIDASSLSFLSRERSKLEKLGSNVMMTVPVEYETVYRRIKEH